MMKLSDETFQRPYPIVRLTYDSIVLQPTEGVINRSGPVAGTHGRHHW